MSRKTPIRPSTSNGTSSPSTSACPNKVVGLETHPGPRTSSQYPLSYSPSIVGLDVLDHVNLMHFRKKPSWLDFKASPPKRVLDLGCGSGAWILDAAKQWPSCYFVGYDIAKIQPNHNVLPLMISERICWLHGDFLKDKFPFEDDFFDYIHISHIAWGVPENAWDGLFEEIARILRPGGAVEIDEEDILFPTLPRSYTLKTKQTRPLSYIKNLDTIISISPLNEPIPVPHAHALIESLFFGVFEKRMINPRPTSIIPHHLNIHFRKVTSTAPLEYPFPPPPLSRLRLHDIASSEISRSRPESQTYSSFGSRSSVSSLDSDQGRRSSLDSPDSPGSRRHSRPSRQMPPQHYSRTKPLPPAPPYQHTQPLHPQMTPTTTLSSHSPSSSISEPAAQVHKLTFGSFKPTTGIPLFPPVTAEINSRNLALQLNTVYQRIAACKESMWKELQRRLALRRAGMQDLLSNLGWDEEAEGIIDESTTPRETQERTLFDGFIMRFERDMRYRTALADSIENALGWQRPPPAPMSKYERQRAMELEDAVIEAAKAEARMDISGYTQFSRSCKTFIGFKEMKKS